MTARRISPIDHYHRQVQIGETIKQRRIRAESDDDDSVEPMILQAVKQTLGSTEKNADIIFGSLGALGDAMENAEQMQ
ncbi:hypothetical protein SDC9_195009 [bioreactor metagenome]|uniref:Uncharacterized protein n=1 Tax=bioreactor metagenome TaxID=1076179 RepID=A0A645I7T3_9ZZZZ